MSTPNDPHRRVGLRLGSRAGAVVALATLFAGLSAACGDEPDTASSSGANGGADGPQEVVPAAAELLDPKAFGASSIRRQSRAELRASLTDVFGVDPGVLVDSLPADVTGAEVVNPFDNDAELQDVSTDLVVRMSDFAKSYAALVIQKPATLFGIAGCSPAKADDAACFDKVVRAVGRLALRRTVTDAEVTRFGEFLSFAREENDFGSALDAFVRVLVQHPEVLYRVEVGRPTAEPGVFALGDHEIATRLAFLLWGRTPDATLLDAADAGTLQTPAGRRAQAERMLGDARAKQHWSRFHAQWLGYANVTPPAALAADMNAESAALVDRVVFSGDREWLDLFRSDETFLTPTLAAHYGMTPPAKPGWVKYEGARGGGILSHGAFLLQGSKFGDTSPTLRGYRVLKRVLCKELGAIPPGIDTDNPPVSSPNACKAERYSMRSNAACAGCHTQTDDIGFGLENFGPSGEWRQTEPGLPSCTIDGKGAVGARAFSGPRELGQALAADPALAVCADRQLLRFALGRADTPEDKVTLDALDAQLASKKQLGSLLRALAETPAIAHRIERKTP